KRDGSSDVCSSDLAAIAWAALPRFARPGRARLSSLSPAGESMPLSSTAQEGCGRRNSRPSASFLTEYQSSSVRTICPPVRGQLTESPNQPAPADTHTTFGDRKSTRLNSSHVSISYAVFCLKKKQQ